MPSIFELYRADYRVRSYIAKCLKDIVQPQLNGLDEFHIREASFQLALCYTLGFGVVRNCQCSREYLVRSGRDRSELELQITFIKELGKTVPFGEFRDGMFKSLRLLRHIGFVNHAQTYLEHKQLAKMKLEYIREIADFRAAIGDGHPILIMLQSTLSSIWNSLGDFKEAGRVAMQAARECLMTPNSEIWAAGALLVHRYHKLGWFD